MLLPLSAALILTVSQVQPGVPNQQPQLAVSSKSIDLVFGSGHSIWLLESTDGGAAFSAPKKLIEVPAMALGRHRGPRVAIAGNTIVVSAVSGPRISTDPHAHGLPQDGDLLAWRSTDRGLTWSKPVTVNDVPGSAREGLHSMVAAGDGTLAAVWLDLRAPGTKLFGSYSKDGGASWSKNVLVYQSADSTICQCCHPSIAASHGNKFYVMFRNVVGGARDMYSLPWDLVEGPGPLSKMGSGSWAINACPMDGGGLATDGKKVVSAWRRGETVYLADASGHEQELGEGNNVTLAVTGKGSFVAWAGKDGIRLKRPDSDSPVAVAATGNFPTLTALPGDRLGLAWEDHGEIKFEIVR